jgi:hypothetical protein
MAAREAIHFPFGAQLSGAVASDEWRVAREEAARKAAGAAPTRAVTDKPRDLRQLQQPGQNFACHSISYSKEVMPARTPPRPVAESPP